MAENLFKEIIMKKKKEIIMGNFPNTGRKYTSRSRNVRVPNNVYLKTPRHYY